MPAQLSAPIEFCHAANDDHTTCLEVDCVWHGEFDELLQDQETGVFFCPECGRHNLAVKLIRQA